MSHRKHHYVPAFLLEQWHDEDTRKLVSCRWAHGALRSHPHTAQHVAKADHLYSMMRSARQPNVAAERDFLGPHVDDPAAKVHKKILADGVRSLSTQDRAVWSRFLVAQLLRIPRMVEHMRGKGADVLRRQLQDHPDEYEAVRGDAAEESLYEWALENSPDIFDDLAIQTLPSLVQSEVLNRAFLGPGVSWATRQLHGSVYELLIGDAPLIVAGTFATNYLACLPLGPRMAFFAFNNPSTWEQVTARSESEVAKEINWNTVQQADTYVYARTMAQFGFIEKHLKRPPG